MSRADDAENENIELNSLEVDLLALMSLNPKGKLLTAEYKDGFTYDLGEREIDVSHSKHLEVMEALRRLDEIGVADRVNFQLTIAGYRKLADKNTIQGESIDKRAERLIDWITKQRSE